MNPFLMYRDRDFVMESDSQSIPPVVDDLGLAILCESMAAGDKFLYAVSQQVLLEGLQSVEEILFRQQVLRDCLRHPDVVRATYRIAVEALEADRRNWSWLFSKTPEGILYRSIEVLQLFLEPLGRLRRVCVENGDSFESEGFKRFFGSLKEDTEPTSLGAIREHLRILKNHDAVAATAGLGYGNRIDHLLVHRPADRLQTWLERLRRMLAGLKKRSLGVFVYEIAEQDESGARALSDIRGKALAPIARDLERSANHVRSFFSSIRTELGFYIACHNLRDGLSRYGGLHCFPEPFGHGGKEFSVTDLYDLSLLLTSKMPVVGNDLNSDGKDLVMISGPNRGGKSTFLRSIGIAQLMMQAGMFVPGRSMRASMCRRLFTHFKREEDATMTRGKFDEELSQMSGIIDSMAPADLILLNESFGATNQREGAEIAEEIVEGLRKSGVRVFYVTHMTDLIQTLWDKDRESTLFLRAERLSDGSRTFRVQPGEPEATSYAGDLYARIFDRRAS